MKPKFKSSSFCQLLSVCALIFSFCFLTPANAASLEGKKAPEFIVKTLSGNVFNSQNLLGHVVIIHFWATWCEACQKEMPAFEHFYSKHYKQNLKLFAISLDDEKDESLVRKMASEFSFDTALDKDTVHKGFGRIWRLPMTFVIDKEGIVRKDGWSEENTISEEALEKVASPLMK